jgi:hypothetical protein
MSWNICRARIAQFHRKHGALPTTSGFIFLDVTEGLWHAAAGGMCTATSSLQYFHRCGTAPNSVISDWPEPERDSG